jgi:hypothetical protein
MEALTPADIASEDCGYWATEYNRIKLQNGYYSFAERPYLLEPMSSRFRRRCYMKGTQGGGSLLELIKSLKGMIYRDLPFGVLYMFPTTDDVHEFSRAILGPLIVSNKASIGKYIKNVRGGTDTTSLKQVNGANLFMRGANLSKVIEGEGESTKLKAISVDKVVFDEIELMEPEVIAKAKGRLGNSQVKEEVYIGNPGIPGRGIDDIFQHSDQRYWHRKCLHCGSWTCAELTFPDCVKIRTDGTGYIGCIKCGREVFVRDGEWVASVRDNSEYMHGYRWSQLTSPNNDPAEILEDFTNPPQGNLADVYRLRLGLPYVATEDQLTTAQVFSRCGPFLMGNQDIGPCAFGLDVGRTKHLVIGKRTGVKSHEIVKAIRLSSWDDIANIIYRFNCRSGVIDIRPYEDEARRFQQAHRNIRIFLCEYSENTPVGTVYNQHTGIVKVNRTEICDATHNLVADEGRLSLPRNCEEIQEFAREVCNPAKMLEVNKKTKIAVYRYKGTEDHYRHALNYYLLAAEKIGIAPRGLSAKKYDKVMNDYQRI